MTDNAEDLDKLSKMNLFDLFQLLDNEMVPQRSKLHLAVWDGVDNPLDVYLAGQFDEWQSRQSKQNFPRDFVISLIALSPSKWLFVGAYDSIHCEWVEKYKAYRYQLKKRKKLSELEGRLVVYYTREGRQSYRNAETCYKSLSVLEIRPEKMRIADFPGYHRVLLTKKQLDIVMQEDNEAWKAALSGVAGVYVIVDRETGKLYIGSATSEMGIWGRWREYSATGHGGNRELKKLLKAKGDDYAENFQYGILEIADTHATAEYVLQRESRWKTLLMTRTHGYNVN